MNEPEIEKVEIPGATVLISEINNKVTKKTNLVANQAQPQSDLRATAYQRLMNRMLINNSENKTW